MMTLRGGGSSGKGSERKRLTYTLSSRDDRFSSRAGKGAKPAGYNSLHHPPDT